MGLVVVLLVLLRPLARKLSVKQKDQMVSGAKAMIGKQAMDHGLSRGSIARRIVEDLK